MIFRKAQSQQVEADEPCRQLLAWPNGSARLQQMWVNVNRWDFVVQPWLQARNMLSMDFKLYGKAGHGPLKGMRVTASLEMRERDNPPDFVKARWPDHTDGIQGYGRAEDADGYGVALDLTLFCQPGAFEWVNRVVSAGATPGGTLACFIELDSPSVHKEDFWKDEWVGAQLRVAARSAKLNYTASRKDEEDQPYTTLLNARAGGTDCIEYVNHQSCSGEERKGRQPLEPHCACNFSSEWPPINHGCIVLPDPGPQGERDRAAE